MVVAPRVRACVKRRDGQTPDAAPTKKTLKNRKKEEGAWRTDRRGGARDLPRAQGEDMAELMSRMMSMISSSSSGEQSEPDGMLESDSE